MKTYYLLLLLLCLSAALPAQTTLGPGDVMFTLINTDNTDAFAFVLLKDVTAGTTFRVTKGEYQGGVLQTGDGTTEITFTSASSCGAEFLFTSQLNTNGTSTGIYDPTALNGGGSVTSNLVEGSSLTLSSAGDGLIAFQGSTYLTIVQKCGHEFGSDVSQCSDLPPGLTEGTNALFLNNPAFPVDNTQEREPDNVKFDCSFITGTPAQIAAALSTPSRWLQDDLNTISYGSGCGFTCQAGCVDPVLNSVTSSPANPCPGDQVTLTINGSRGDANAWRLHEGLCGNTILQTTQGQTFTITAGANTTYFVSALDCNNNQICASTPVTPAVEAANAGADQLLLSGVTAVLNGNFTGAGTGAWSILSGDGNGGFNTPTSPSATFTGTAGQAYTLRWTVSGGGCVTTFDEVEISFTQGGTTLATGDLAFIGFNSDAPDEFSFITLKEIEAGTFVFFTDMGWLQSGSFRSTAEGIIGLTFDRNYGCGDAFHLTRTTLSGNNWEAFDEAGTTAGTVSIPPVPGIIPDIGTIGDQVFAFQGSLGSPTLLAGIHVGEAWSDATDNSSSAQPAALTGNNTSVNLTQDFDNGIYDCSVTSGVPSVLRTAINNASNWNLSADLIPLTPACDFNCQDCAEPVITSLSASPEPICAGQTTTITVTGDLMGATRWVVYAPGDCGGTELSTSTGGNTITFIPAGSGDYLVAGIEGCVATPICSPITITRTGNPAEITMQQPTTKISGTSVALTAAPLGAGQTGAWTIVSGTDNGGSITDPSGPGATLTGTEGNGYQLRYTVTGNGCPETTDEVFVSFLVDNGVSFGGMVFTGYNSQPADNFSVLVLESLTAGTAFSVTDNGWLAAGGFRAGEQTANYFLCRPLGCGDNIRFEDDGNGYAPDGTVVAELQAGSSFPEIGSIGDQLFLYSGFTAPTAGDESGFVAAIQMNCENGTCSEANWDGDAIDNSASGKPSVFAAGGSVFGGTAPTNNARYDCTNGTSNENDLFALVTNDANWSFQNGAFTLDGCGFTCDPPPVAVCQDITVEIDANGNPTTNGQPFMASDLDGGSTDNGSTDPNGFSVDITPGCANVTIPVSATTITLTVTDDLGQTSTCTSQVTVEDNVAPTGTCQNIAVDLNANGTVALNSFAVGSAVLTSFNDNCAAGFASFGVTAGTVGCDRLGTNSVTYFYRDRPLSGTSREFSCTVQIQINDPLGVCGSDPVANCQDFAAGPDANGNYTLDANSLDNGSTDDRSVYTLVFGTERNTIGQQSDAGGNFNNTGHGQSFTAPQTGNIQKIKVRFFAAKSNATLYLYNSGTGSGMAGSVGTPAYTQTGIELFAGPTGGLTEILLDTPFPVVSGQQYSFAFDGNTHPYYSTADVYPGGDFIFDYDLSSGCCNFGDLVFEVDFIGPTTQELTGDGDYPVTVYAVDDQGNVSGACNATFMLDQSLPVEWLSFGANAGAKTVELQWETSAEPDNAGFHVERSATGTDWAAIGEVPARTGNDQRYEFEDEAPLQGTSYYRLRQTDFDGQVSYSPVETVAFYGDDRVVIFPNPATNEVNVQLPAGAELIGLIDVTGRMTKVRFNGENGRLRTDVSGLPAGIYFLRIRLADGELSARRLMVR